MKIRHLSRKGILFLSAIISALVYFNLCLAQDLAVIKLPQPQTDGGKPLMQALKERKSSREFSSKQLPMQVISNLLWAAFGLNRPDSKGRTAPSSSNRQEMDIYVANESGLYLYNAFQNTLELVLAKDIRAVTGIQDFVKDAALELIFVADFSRGQNEVISACDTGYISQNVYLYCASEGLATVARGAFNGETLAKEMKLRPNQKIILTQTVGYPG